MTESPEFVNDIPVVVDTPLYEDDIEFDDDPAIDANVQALGGDASLEAPPPTM